MKLKQIGSSSMLPASMLVLKSAMLELVAAQEGALSGGSEPCVLSSSPSERRPSEKHDLDVFSGRESEAADS
eukprot:CAMPEP_0169194352 /NCGR_PEP_ID=MMETSP1016-20121227/6651_1 /TAXON_ID=342587 /ORGANISM="Karlodinium micrum, Strain CCMP2283" /LENGTH=71 /DNA_ID=CAMNT_0009270851 /DNA_START=304 /DNA_END=519 /DNA_ORIENTATION=+